MATSLADDVQRFNELKADFPTKPTVSDNDGKVIFAGTLWPAEAQKGASIKYQDVRTSIAEARDMVHKGYLLSLAALRGHEAGVEAMQLWFGARPAAPYTDANPDWWDGASRILGVIEGFIARDVSVYYRGDDSLIGQASDYPKPAGTPAAAITAHDVAGYAESQVGVMNSIIGLCSTFFKKETKTGMAKTNLRGFDSVGGVLVHELSHNLCETDDHDTAAGGTCYGVAACKQLAIDAPSRAWYNADNIEYFCEQALYGDAVAAQPIATGAASAVSAIAGMFNKA